MTGTLINVAAVLAGAAIGTAAGARLPLGVQQRVMSGLALITLVLGVDLALAWRDTSPLYVLGGILLGGMAGEALGIERRLQRAADRLQAAALARMRGGRGASGPRVSEAWLTASLLFCVGPLAVVGALQDGLHGDSEALVTKAVLDGFASVALAATLGWGVALAAVSVLAFQGSIALGAGALDSVLQGEPLAALTSAGGVLIVGLSLKLAELKDVRVGNFLPALVVAPGLALLVPALL